MSANNGDIARLGVWIVDWNVLLHGEVEKVLLAVGSRSSMGTNVLARKNVLFYMKRKVGHVVKED